MSLTFYSKKLPTGFRTQLSVLLDEELYNEYDQLGYFWIYTDGSEVMFSPSVFDFIPFEIDTSEWCKIGIYPIHNEVQFINNEHFVRRLDENIFEIFKGMEKV